MNVNDIVFRRNSTVNTPSNIVTNSLAYAASIDAGFSFSLAPTTSAAAAESIGSATTTRKIASTSTAIDLGEGRLGKDTVALYTNKFLSSSTIQNTQGIVFRAIIGGDGIKAI